MLRDVAKRQRREQIQRGPRRMCSRAATKLGIAQYFTIWYRPHNGLLVDIRLERGEIAKEVSLRHEKIQHHDTTKTTKSNFSLAAVPMGWAVDIVPALKYLPGWVPGTGSKKNSAATSQDRRGFSVAAVQICATPNGRWRASAAEHFEAG